MNALRMGLDVAVDTIREVASKYEDSGPSTSGYGVGPPKIESGAYSTGRMQGFGRDGGRHHMEAPSDSTAHREREVERTATGAPKVESGYYSTGKMRGFGSDDVRPNYPKPGSALDRQWNGGGAERVEEGWTRSAGPEGGFIRSSAAGGGGGGGGGGWRGEHATGGGQALRVQPVHAAGHQAPAEHAARASGSAPRRQQRRGEQRRRGALPPLEP